MTEQSRTRGVMYVAWGKDHVDVARRSAASVRAHNPGMSCAIWCAAEDDTSGFNEAFVIPAEMTRPKVGALKLSPYDETLYLDNDTMIRADLSSLFDLLKRFDLCGAHVMLWHRPRHKRMWQTEVPETFPEINCGVLLYRKSPETDGFFDDWQAAYDAAGMKIDQPTFRETLWNSDLRFYVFPPQYNKRIFEASELIYSDQPKPRILHLPILRPQKNVLKRWFSNLIR